MIYLIYLYHFIYHCIQATVVSKIVIARDAFICLLPLLVVARMEKAIELYEMSKTIPSPCGFGPCLVTLSAGTPHVPPPRDNKEFPLYEATIGAQYLLERGIPARNIFEEKLSLDTLGNVCCVIIRNAYICI
jgi:hypothetical protein